MSSDEWATAAAVLRLAAQLVESIQDGVTRRGFSDVRPSHGFVFVRVSAGDATTADVAVHLGVTKQAAAQLVDYLVTHGYIERHPDPGDARARLLVLTERGRACTVAAEAAAAEAVEAWKSRLGQSAFSQLEDALRALQEPGRLRPNW